MAEAVMSGRIFIPCSPDEISYTVAEDGSSITFRPCGITSCHPEDVRQRYCAACNRFMDLVELARELSGQPSRERGAGHN